MVVQREVRHCPGEVEEERSPRDQATLTIKVQHHATHRLRRQSSICLRRTPGEEKRENPNPQKRKVGEREEAGGTTRSARTHFNFIINLKTYRLKKKQHLRHRKGETSGKSTVTGATKVNCHQAGMGLRRERIRKLFKRETGRPPKERNT